MAADCSRVYALTPAVWWTTANDSAVAYDGGGAADQLVRLPLRPRHDRRRARLRERPRRLALERAPDIPGADARDAARACAPRAGSRPRSSTGCRAASPGRERSGAKRSGPVLGLGRGGAPRAPAAGDAPRAELDRARPLPVQPDEVEGRRRGRERARRRRAAARRARRSTEGPRPPTTETRARPGERRRDARQNPSPGCLEYPSGGQGPPPALMKSLRLSVAFVLAGLAARGARRRRRGTSARPRDRARQRHQPGHRRLRRRRSSSGRTRRTSTRP